LCTPPLCPPSRTDGGLNGLRVDVEDPRGETSRPPPSPSTQNRRSGAASPSFFHPPAVAAARSHFSLPPCAFTSLSLSMRHRIQLTRLSMSGTMEGAPAAMARTERRAAVRPVEAATGLAETDVITAAGMVSVVCVWGGGGRVGDEGARRGDRQAAGWAREGVKTWE